MISRRFGPLDVEVPIVGLGTWHLELADREAAIRAIRRALERGMTHVDTAELYGRGAVEELVGEALAGYRGDAFLASKVHPDRATYAGTLLACEQSLRRLRTDRLDLYLLHWRGSQPLEETFRALETLREDGKVRAWGVSNFDVADLEAAIAIVGEGVIACNQVLYHLRERDAEHVLEAFCEQHRIALVAYSPFGSGDFPADDPVLVRLARTHGITPHTVALAWLARRAFVIPKTSSAAHVDELARAGTLVLDRVEIESIDAAFPLGPPRSVIPTI